MESNYLHRWYRAIILFLVLLIKKTKFGLALILEYLFMMVRRLKISISMMDSRKSQCRLFQDSNGIVWAGAAQSLWRNDGGLTSFKNNSINKVIM